MDGQTGGQRVALLSLLTRSVIYKKIKIIRMNFEQNLVHNKQQAVSSIYGRDHYGGVARSLCNI